MCCVVILLETTEQSDGQMTEAFNFSQFTWQLTTKTKNITKLTSGLPGTLMQHPLLYN